MNFDNSTLELRAERAQKLVLGLQSAGRTPVEIADALGNRISARTLYRWAKGEHGPQRKSDLAALESLAAEWMAA